ncbi:unnamed protein product [Rhizophagus irregularis]|nr:unnamed protein product [Rhizophagus irregularis]
MAFMISGIEDESKVGLRLTVSRAGSAQQHSSVSVEVSSNISNHSDHTSSSNDAISENKENDKKDHLIDSTVSKERFTLQGLSFIWTTDDEGIADIQSCIDKVRPNLYELEVNAAYGLDYCNWMIDCGGERRYSIMLDVIILSDLRDKDGARFETILIEIGNCIVNTLKNRGNVLAVRLRGIPFYAVSPHICGEWMCIERQQKMYLPNNLMYHQDMIEQSLLYYASRTDSSLQKKYQEPCVVFAGHPSLRSSAAINFIRKWGNNSNNSIIFTKSEYDCDCEEAMSAFEGLQVKPIYLPIDIRLTVNEVTNMLRERKPPQHV